jgi:hypothetical protein
MKTSQLTPEDIEFNLLESRLELINSDNLSETLVTPTTPVTEAPEDSECLVKDLQRDLDVYSIVNECSLGGCTLADYLISLGYHK